MTRAVYQIHINKTGGTTAGSTLGLPFRHRDIGELIDDVGEDAISRAFVFSFVRNPWDRVVSHYHWRVKTNQTGLGTRPVTFEDWVIRCYRDRSAPYYDKPRMFRQQIDWLRKDGRGALHPAIDFIGRFETLQSDIETLAETLGQEAPGKLVHLKPSERRADYRTYYSDRTREIIRNTFAEDIAYFDYAFT